MNYQVSVTHSIHDISTEKWDALCVGYPFRQHRWLRLLEATLAHYEPRYIQIEQEEELKAGAICYLQRTFRMDAYLDNNIIRQLGNAFFTRVPPLSCSVATFSLSGLIIRCASDTAVWQSHLLNAIEQLAKQERSVLTGFDAIKPEDRASLLAHKTYCALPIVPESYINIKWDDFKTYQAELPKKNRAETRRVRNRAQEQGVTIESIPLSPEFSPRIEQLIRFVAERHGNTYAYQPDLIARALPILEATDYRLLLACQDGDIIGCVALFQSEGEVVIKWVGLDYPRTEPTFAYHYLMTDTVRHAIEMGATRLTTGMTAYTLKKKMGAVLEDRYLLLNLRYRPLNHLANLVLARQQRK